MSNYKDRTLLHHPHSLGVMPVLVVADHVEEAVVQLVACLKIGDDVAVAEREVVVAFWGREPQKDEPEVVQSGSVVEELNHPPPLRQP